jgi:hypothetical protein
VANAALRKQVRRTEACHQPTEKPDSVPDRVSRRRWQP